MSKCMRALFAVTFLAAFLVASSAARAQVTPGSVIVGADVGYLHTSLSEPGSGSSTTGSTDPTYTFNRYTVGATGGYNLIQYLGVFFEYNYDSVVSNDAALDGLSLHANNYGGAARFYLLPKSKIVPYAVFGGGGAQLTGSVSSGGSQSYTGNYFGGGGGVAYYITKNIGAAADVRFNRASFTISGVTINPDLVSVTGGVFYQFGGKKMMK